MMAVMPEMPPSDPFSKAVDKARQRLSYTRGGRLRGRRVDADIVRKLAAVLPVDEADLIRAAQEAAGYRVREDAVVDPVAYVLDAVQAFYGNASIDQGQRDKVTAEILRIIADRM